MIKTFTMPHLQQPFFANPLQRHYVYIIKKKGDNEQPFRVRCTSVEGQLYMLNIINNDDSPTDNWIQLNHEDYHNDFELVEGVTTKEELRKLQEELRLTIKL